MTFNEYIEKNISYEVSLRYRLSDLTSKNLTDIYGIEKYSNITKLFLGFNSISDLEPLKYLTKLKYLYLHNNSITNIKPLKNLDLYILDISENNISNIDAILDMENLKDLKIYKNELITSYEKYMGDDVWLNGENIKELKSIIITERRKRLINQLSL